MALTPQQVRTVYRDLTDQYLKDKPADLTKDDFKAAIAAADAWIDANAVSFNLALPPAFRTAATASQKASLLAFVALTKFRG